MQLKNLKKSILSEALEKADKLQPKCFIGDCSEPAINSHSQSKGCSLKHISVNGEVIRLANDPFSFPGSPFEPVGIKKASIFKGFCNKHDNEYFRVVDNLNPANLTKEALFRLAFRTFAMQVRAKELRRNTLSAIISKSIGVFHTETRFMTTLVQGIDICLNTDCPHYLQRFEIGFAHNYYDDAESAVFIIERNIGLSTSSVISPLLATSSNEYGDELMALDFQPAAFFTVLPNKQKTMVIFTYFLSDKKLIMDFIERHNKIEDVVFNYCEEVLLSPSLFNSLNANTKTKIVKGLRPWYDWHEVKFPVIFDVNLVEPQYY